MADHLSGIVRAEAATLKISRIHFYLDSRSRACGLAHVTDAHFALWRTAGCLVAGQPGHAGTVTGAVAALARQQNRGRGGPCQVAVGMLRVRRLVPMADPLVKN